MTGTLAWSDIGSTVVSRTGSEWEFGNSAVGWVNTFAGIDASRLHWEVRVVELFTISEITCRSETRSILQW